ncbi:hypothetical protein SNOG_00698 [Parastagonospora nodorum SN15]|uniref:Uncharacterized protein n=1 Tax=Phaeosphaeria nodorum (strain SN15 / ATCC MYA-4574 / FGSC 10173) TaxID=321614 RepID=Q0V5L6_PHANO|nr:hypothetical protein SNOG_00698 [Parastagonospora nodorum SN15]EAT92193.1 hypothetical protein SNOG_00698 [Parastagonospora nodorum SN15]
MFWLVEFLFIVVQVLSERRTVVDIVRQCLWFQPGKLWE